MAGMWISRCLDDRLGAVMQFRLRVCLLELHLSYLANVTLSSFLEVAPL